jgi:hypothetical protein
MARTYFLAKVGKWMNSMTDEFMNYGGAMEWMAFSLESSNYKIFEESYDESNPRNRHYILNETIAIKGFRSFAEVRDTIKVLSTDFNGQNVLFNTATEEEASTAFDAATFEWDSETRELTVTPPTEVEPTKVSMAMDQQRKDAAVLAMKAVAKAVIEEEFDKRLIKADLSNALEDASFVYQWEEAKAWEADNSVETPLLTALATARDLTVEQIVAKINTARNNHKTRVTKLIQKMAQVKQAYKICTTIPEMNRFYEDYFNVEMPFQQAIADGRLVLDEENGREVRTQVLGIGLNF